MAYTTIDDSEIYFKQITYTGTGNVQALEGLNHKPSVMLADNIAAEVDEDKMEDILFNTSEFKKIIGR